jgi:phosphate acetyltransferase
VSRSLYIAATGPRSGKSLVTLGLMEFLTGQSRRIGFFRPIVTAEGQRDKEIALISRRYGMQPGDRAVAAFTHEQARQLIASAGLAEVHKEILATYKALEERCDFVLCEGTDYSGVASAFEFEFNVEVALNLGCPVLTVINGLGHGRHDLVDQIRFVTGQFEERGCRLAATIVNRVSPAVAPEMRAALTGGLESEAPVYVIPEESSLTHPTMRDVSAALDAEQLNGTDQSLDKEVLAVKVAAMGLANFLGYVGPGSLIIVPGDRADILVGSLLANRSPAYPTLAGLVLTGGLLPDERVQRLISGVADAALPIVAVQADTYTVATRISEISGWITADSERKLALALGIFQAAVDLDDLSRRVALTRSDAVTPLMFEYQLIKRAAGNRRRIVLPEAEDERILRAADIVLRRGVADLVLLGDLETVRRRISALGLDLQAAELIDPAASPLRAKYAEIYCGLRKHKGITLDVAMDVMRDCSYFGTMMVHLGQAHGMVSGAANTTAHTIRPAFEFIKTRPGVSLVSSVFFMCLEDRVLVYGDCAVNPEPSAEELADIATSAADTATMFGIEPRIAMLSYSTGESGSGADVDRVREATRLAREKRPELLIEGPIQYDAAADASVARTKMPDSQVAGRATVFIFPDLNAGNNAYKAVQRSAHAVAIGPILQGLNKPVNDLSRGCTVTDIVNTVAITAIQAQEAE